MQVGEGDVVLVRGKVRKAERDGKLLIDFTADHFVPAHEADVALVEEANFQAGDTVACDNRLGTVLCINGNYAWVQPHDPSVNCAYPVTTDLRDLKRPPSSPSEPIQVSPLQLQCSETIAKLKRRDLDTAHERLVPRVDGR